MKELYKFTVDKEVDKEVVVETAEGKLTKIEKVKEPVVIILKQPSRLEREEADLFYSTWLAKYTLTYGLPTRAMLTKRYADSGGALSEEEKKRFGDLMLKIYQKEMEIKELSSQSEKDKETIEKAEAEMIAARSDLIDFQIYQNTLFQNTAESKAQTKVIYWLALFLTFTEKGEPFFKGNDFDQRIAQYDKMEESEDPFETEVLERVFSLWSYYYLSNAKNSKDLAQYEQTLKENQESDG